MKLPAAVRARVGGWDLVVLSLGTILLVVFATVPDTDIPADTTPQSLDWLAAIILAAAGGALLLRHRYPLTVVVIVLGLIGWWHFEGYTNGLINLAGVMAYFAVGATGDRPKQTASILLTIAPLAGLVVFGDESWRSLVDAIGWPLAALLLGELSRSRRALMDSYQRRAERAEADREAEAHRRVSEERLRIARDLHDLVAHTVSAMMVQAGVAADKFESAPERARAAIDHIRVAGRQASNEVRATIELLRAGDEPALAPAPTVSDIHRLVTNVEQLGLDVDCTIEEGAADIDALVALTAYRVVQEALTNVVRHSTATHVSVTIGRDNSALTCAVRDDGAPSHPSRTDGHGLAGMNERVALVGGRLRYGDHPDGGFEVVSVMPITAGRQ